MTSSGPIKGWVRHAALAAAIALPLAAAAQQAIVSGGGNLRAGPDRSYPVVAQIVPGTPATVMGCVSGYGWCDVVVPGGLRGWMFSGRLDYAYQGAPVPLVSIGAAIGVPIVTFTLGTYWNNYYRDRPWYRDTRWWGGRRPPPPVAGWRPPSSYTPRWEPRQPPAQWRPPQRPGGPAARPPERPGMVAPRPQALRQQPAERRPPPAPNRRPPERRDNQNHNR